MTDDPDHINVRIWVDRAGAVEDVKVYGQTPSAAYEEQLVTKVKTWRYKPYVVDGVATPICFTMHIDRPAR